jgi:Holliday junction resolvase RusA-like endonuclease
MRTEARMTSITFTVPGPPRGKGRPRFTRTGHTYTPEETASYENLVRLAYQANANGRAPAKGSVKMTIVAYMPMPKAWTEKKRVGMHGLYHTKKVDLDNVIKSVLDGLDGVAFDDDAQVSQITAYKFYGMVPGLEVTIETKEADA